MIESLGSPLVSVIMPIRNEEKAIGRSLSAVLAQDYPVDRLEVIVADGMSTDETRSIVGEIARHDARVHLIDNGNRIMTAGFNAGLTHARGEVIVMLGGHTQIEPDYVRSGVRVLQQGKADCVGGPIRTVCDTGEAAAISLAMSSPFGVGNVAFRVNTSKEKYVDTVAFGAYTREIINRAGPLDAELVRNQDDEYNYRIRGLGARILLVPEIRSSYSSRSSLRSLWRQYFQYGFWKVRVLQKHPRQMRPRQFAPPLFVAVLLLLILTAPFSSIGAWGLGSVVGLYALANLGASAFTARGSNSQVLWLLPFAFATLHLSYGLGFLVGLCRFVNRWKEHERRRLNNSRPPAAGAEQME